MRYELRLHFDGTDSEVADRLACSLAVNDLAHHVGPVEAELIDTFSNDETEGES